MYAKNRFRIIPASGVWAALLGVAIVGLPASALAQEEKTEVGMFITVPSPLNSTAVEGRIQRLVDEARTRPKNPVRVVVFDFNPDDKPAETRNYGDCYNLAKYIRSLSRAGVNTVAFVHNSVSRHTVLPVLACNEVVMSPQGKLGKVIEVEDPALPRQEVEGYLDFAGPTRAAFVKKMFDKNVDIVQGLKNQATHYFDRAERNAPENQDVVFDPNRPSLIPPGRIMLYNSEEATRYNLCQKICATRQEVAEALNLAPSSLREDSLIGGARAARIVISGRVDGTLLDSLRRQISDAVNRNENLLFFELVCTGEDTAIAEKIADMIKAETTGEKRVLTVAFVTAKLSPAATFIALACSEIVMVEDADLGDFSEMLQRKSKKGEQGVNPELLASSLARIGDQYSPALIKGMFVANMSLYRIRGVKGENANQRRVVSDIEWENMKDQGAWTREKEIKAKGQLLKLDAALAKELGIARHVVSREDGFAGVSRLYGAEKVRDAEYHWLDRFASFLRLPIVAVFLVVLGVGCLILELKAPGMTIPGIIAAICFVLFFWAQSYLSEKIVYLAILMFVLGLIFLGIEIFILPGFGVTGVTGILLVLAGLGLASVDKLPSTTDDWFDFGTVIVKYGLSVVVAGIGAFIVARYLPSVPYANRLILPPDEAALNGELTPLPGVEQAAALLGQTGTAMSTLRPAGMAQFGEQYVDVVTDGSYIEAGSAIQVIEVEGTRIVVKKLS